MTDDNRLRSNTPWSRREVLFGLGSSAAALAIGCQGDASAVTDASTLTDARVLDDGALCAPTRADLTGPFFEPGAPMRVQIADAAEPGERLVLRGTVRAADCTTPLAGVVVDVWQANRDGDYYPAGQEYRLRGEVTTDANGEFRVETIRPGNYLLGAGFRPAHVHFTFTRAGQRTLTTQIYFAGDRYHAPVDSCDTCGSDDALRIVALTGDAAAGWTGDLTIVLADA